MAVITVKGAVDKSQLGVVLPHEHLLIDLELFTAAPLGGESVFYDKLSIENLRYVKKDPYSILDNAKMDSEQTAVQEMLLFKKSGGSTVVDVTLDSIGRDAAALRRISDKSGVNIIMGCGWYVDKAHPACIGEATESELAAQLLREIEYGAQDTGIKPGVIGEIGTSAVITANEWKCLYSAAAAAKESGLAMHIHTGIYQTNGTEIADRLIALGVPPHRIAINHVDVDINIDYIAGLLDKGIFVEFDNFGKEFYISGGSGTLTGRFAYDLERAKALAALIKRGYGDRLLITNDICLKHMLCSYGGFGYGHITDNIVPMLKDCGVSDREINSLLVKNPAEFLDIKHITV